MAVSTVVKATPIKAGSTTIAAAAPANGPSTTKASGVVAAASGNNQTGFSQLVSKLQAYVAPTTGDTVHFGQYGTSGQYVYIGPDGQPYIGTKSDFAFSGSGSTMTVSPTKNAKPTTFAALGIDAPTVVTESTYTGPGAAPATANDAAYATLLAADAPQGGASLVVGKNSLSGMAAGTYDEVGGVLAQVAGLAPTTTSTPVTAPVVAQNNTNDSGASATATDPVTGTTATDNPQTAASGLLASGEAGSDGVAGSGSIASDVPVATDSDTTTSSGPNGTVIVICIVAVLAIIGGYLWYRSKHKGAKKPGE